MNQQNLETPLGLMSSTLFTKGQEIPFRLGDAKISMKFLSDTYVECEDEIMDLKSAAEFDAESSSTLDWDMVEITVRTGKGIRWFVSWPGNQADVKGTELKMGATNLVKWTNPKGEGDDTGKFNPCVFMYRVPSTELEIGAGHDLRGKEWKEYDFTGGEIITASIDGRSFSFKPKESGKVFREGPFVSISFKMVTIPEGLGYRHDNLVDIIVEESDTLRYAHTTNVAKELMVKSAPMDAGNVYSPKMIYCNAERREKSILPSFVVRLTNDEINKRIGENCYESSDGIAPKIESNSEFKLSPLQSYTIKAGEVYAFTIDGMSAAMKPYRNVTLRYTDDTIEVEQNHEVFLGPGEEPYYDDVALITVEPDWKVEPVSTTEISKVSAGNDPTYDSTITYKLRATVYGSNDYAITAHVKAVIKAP